LDTFDEDEMCQMASNSATDMEKIFLVLQGLEQSIKLNTGHHSLSTHNGVTLIRLDFL
jgi:hypothetical protein